MRRVGSVILIVMMILGLTVVCASATASGPPASNLACSISGCDTTLLTVSSCPGGTCTPLQIVYLKWDFDANPPASNEPFSTARLTLTTSKVQLAGNSAISFQLWPANDFSEATISNPGYSNTPPPLGTAALTLNDGNAPQQVVFDTANSPTLVSYLESRRNDNGRTGPGYASLAVVISSNNAFAPTVTFANRTSGTPPYLDLRNPTAVTLSTFGSADPFSNWLLIVGLAVLAVIVVVGGVTIYRRRAAVRA